MTCFGHFLLPHRLPFRIRHTPATPCSRLGHPMDRKTQHGQGAEGAQVEVIQLLVDDVVVAIS